MNYKISFSERAKLAQNLLSKQLPVSLEEAKEQAQWLKKVSSSESKLGIVDPNEILKNGGSELMKMINESLKK